MSYYDFPKYVSVAEKRTKAEKKLKQLKKKNPNMQPVIIEGRTLAQTWWGKEWNKNLERYADYSNRIGRGRSYVRHSAVLDLKITPGKVTGLVQGSQSKPYEVTISIKAIEQKNWSALKTVCKGKMESLQSLMAGQFPKEMAALFTQEGKGLFPTPKDISFDCSCPDWASMCKHVAAVLYGIGARLDNDPNLFFILRKVNSQDLISQAITESKNDLLSKASRKTSRVLESNTDLSDIFGIDIGDSPARQPSVKQKKQPPVKPAKTKSTTKPKSAPAPVDALSQIEAIIKKEKNGVKVADIIESSGLGAQKVRNTITRLKQMGRIESAGWGVYILSQT